MNKLNAMSIAKNARMFISKHSPEILVGVGIAGMITTTVLAVKATPKALKLLEEAERKNIDKQLDDGIDEADVKNGLPPLEIIKAAWKPYIPAAITCATSIACIVGASSVHVRRNAALATAYKLSETALSEYKEKVVETIGEHKEKIVKDKVAEKRISENPVSENKVIVTDRGGTLCFDPLSGRYFKSDIEQIRKAVNNLNEQMLHDIFGYVSLNDFYDELGLDHNDVGDELGWNISKGQIKIDFSSQIASNGEPSIVLDYLVAPKYDFSR